MILIWFETVYSSQKHKWGDTVCSDACSTSAVFPVFATERFHGIPSTLLQCWHHPGEFRLKGYPSCLDRDWAQVLQVWCNIDEFITCSTVFVLGSICPTRNIQRYRSGVGAWVFLPVSVTIVYYSLIGYLVLNLQCIFWPMTAHCRRWGRMVSQNNVRRKKCLFTEMHECIFSVICSACQCNGGVREILCGGIQGLIALCVRLHHLNGM